MGFRAQHSVGSAYWRRKCKITYLVHVSQEMLTLFWYVFLQILCVSLHYIKIIVFIRWLIRTFLVIDIVIFFLLTNSLYLAELTKVKCFRKQIKTIIFLFGLFKLLFLLDQKKSNLNSSSIFCQGRNDVNKFLRIKNTSMKNLGDC